MTCPPNHSHSTWCYGEHGCRCDTCRQANTDSARERYQRRRIRRKKNLRQVAPHATRRRLRALAVIGYGNGEVADLIGANRPAIAQIRAGTSGRAVQALTHVKVERIYNRLYMTPSSAPGAGQVRTYARKMGWVAPLDWADINLGIREGRGHAKQNPVSSE